MTNLALLDEKIKESGLSITTLCERANIERANYYNHRKQSDTVDFTLKEAIGLSEVLKLTNKEKIEIFLS